MFRTFALVLVLCLSGSSALADLTPCTWLAHAERDLAGFWMSDRLAGEPVGSFPTFICADGMPFEESDPCPSIEGAPDWIKREIGRQYIRMLSRQVYTYGVIYHLTGSEAALERARAGTRFIMKRAWDKGSGSVATYLVDGEPGLRPGQRTTQSLAYALLGPSFYYYLTRDEDTLSFIQSVRRHIFDSYWSDEWKMLRWTNEDAGEDTKNRMELVAQLDQINAYMLLMLPLLDEESREEWETDLRRLVDSMFRSFYDSERKRFWGFIHEERGRQWGERHNDFGHTAKAFWMLYLAGKSLGNDDWVRISKTGIDDALQAAFVKRNIDDAPDWQAPIIRRAADEAGDYHVWSNQPDGIGIAWWEWCELDQAAATLAITGPGYDEYLDETYRTFFAALVDPVHGGTFGFPGADQGAKGHQWQNGYHAAEHALVGYVTSALRSSSAFRLYFAFPPSLAGVNAPAYYFDAREVGRRPMEELAGGLRKVRVEYGGTPDASSEPNESEEVIREGP